MSNADGNNDAAVGRASKGKTTYEGAGKENREINVFVLDDAFPEASDLFASATLPPTDKCDALVVLDTNALLLPYSLAAGELESLIETYNKLASVDRLFIPARVAREFIDNRDKKLTEWLQGLLNESSRIPATTKSLPPHLRSAPGHVELMEASKALSEARKVYMKAVSKVKDAVEGWRGNDPVTLAYAGLFNRSNIIEHEGDRATIAEEWRIRLRDQIPPGFKDEGKEDTGIGDFLIWKSILNLGRNQKKDLIFVTGEKKTDWMVRLNKEGVYPRPELINEYRRESEGRILRLSSLTHLLKEMNAPENVVKEVKTAEDSANAAARAEYTVIMSPKVHSGHRSIVERSFDYSTHNGVLRIESSVGDFDARFSKAGGDIIYLLKVGSTRRIARTKGVAPNQIVLLKDFDSTSDCYAVANGEAFLIENSAGAILAGRIQSIADDTRNNAPSDNVQFIYSTYPAGAIVISV